MINIKPIEIEDLCYVAQVHSCAFPGRALTQLGPEAVRRYYHWLLTGPHQALNLGAWEGDQLLGFCFGGIFNRAMGGFLQRNRNYLIWRVITHPWLIFNDLIKDRIRLSLRILKFISRHPVAKTTPQDIQPPAMNARPFGILAIAVHPQAQGKGVGKLLMQAEEQEARSRGYTSMGLSVDHHNQQAISFYLAQGWQKVPDDATWDGKMIKQIENTS